MDRGGADLLEAQDEVEGIGRRIGRLRVDLADDLIVPGPARRHEKITVEPAGVAASTRFRRDDDPVDIDEARKAFAKQRKFGLS